MLAALMQIATHQNVEYCKNCFINTADWCGTLALLYRCSECTDARKDLKVVAHIATGLRTEL